MKKFRCLKTNKLFLPFAIQKHHGSTCVEDGGIKVREPLLMPIHLNLSHHSLYGTENQYNTFLNIGLLLCAKISSVFHFLNTLYSIPIILKLVTLDRLNTIFGRKD